MAQANAQQRQEYRRQVQAVFQDPFGVYNPFYRVGHVFDMVTSNFKLAKSKSQIRDMVEESLNVVGLHGGGRFAQIPAPAKRRAASAHYDGARLHGETKTDCG